MDAIQNHIIKLEAEISDCEKNIKKAKESFDNRLRSTYRPTPEHITEEWVRKVEYNNNKTIADLKEVINKLKS